MIYSFINNGDERERERVRIIAIADDRQVRKLAMHDFAFIKMMKNFPTRHGLKCFFLQFSIIFQTKNRAKDKLRRKKTATNKPLALIFHTLQTLMERNRQNGKWGR